ncbi:MAG: hypothetical protein A2474_01380 [Elusimicrobia bacterium RIFOXYC2_FULL_34_12]|nr:MAG: hypothetical protein A2474_01380 [Elusimicrobia bacterium RIFOXYC2_FULL_34_12]HAM38189.1 hypothetical protein [Elusimicrobiota bacterium]
MKNLILELNLSQKLRIINCIILFFVFIFCFFSHSAYSQDISEKVSEGNRLIKEKKYEEALKVLLDARGLDVKSPHPDTSLGILFLMKDDLAEAEKYFKSAEQKNPELVAVKYLLALLYEKKGDKENSVKYWSMLLKNTDFRDTAKKHIKYLEEMK